MQKYSLLDVWRGSEYACVQIAPGNVLCHHSKHLMGYFEFLNVSSIICLPLNISEKLHWLHIFEKLDEAVTHRLYLCLYPRTLDSSICHSKKRGPPPFFYSNTNTWPRSSPFCWQNPCSGCNSRTDLVVVFEYIFFQLCSNTKKIF